MDDLMGFLSFLATPLGYVMRMLYGIVQNYGWTIILFTLLARVVLFPLALKQQKSMAKTSAYQPMIQEIQKKWANDKARQQQEMQKFYEENNINMSAGCAPMLVNMLVLFGMIAVIQAPLNYIVGVPKDQISNAVSIVQAYDPETTIGTKGSVYTEQSILIGEIKNQPDLFINGVDVKNEDGTTSLVKVDQKYVEAIKDFNFQFMGLNLANAPQMKLDRYLIMPILSLLTMVASQIIMMMTTTASAQQGKTQMLMMTLIFGVMFGFYAFRVPVGFSLYYTISNIVMTVQQFIVKRIYDPEEIKKDVIKEIEERRAAKKEKKKVVVKDASGEVISKDMTEAELNKLRLAKARELDEAKYSAAAADQKSSDIADKARQADEEKYGKKNEVKLEENTTNIEQQEEENLEDQEISDSVQVENQQEYKPGRRKRAKQKKDEKSFTEAEIENEKED